jgi:hypothetical protein
MHALDIEGRGAKAFGHIRHIGGGNEEEDGARVDEAADQPWAGDTVHLRPGAGHPQGAAILITRRQGAERHQGQPGLGPGQEAACSGNRGKCMKPLSAPCPANACCKA